ncbi:MAG: ABC transporter ATP-binding protein [Ruminiclostridium sp.]
MSEYAIEIKNVTCKFDGFLLDNISFSVPSGSIMGFVGRNGAGKTTTIRSMINSVTPDSGEIKIFGLDNRKHEQKIKEDIAVVFDEIPFPDTLTPLQLGKVFAGLYKSWDGKHYLSMLERFSLPQKKRIRDFSRGMKMKLQICTALSHNAKLLIMDEATSGLDPVVRSEMLDVFQEFICDEEHSIIMSSHITSDIERIADTVTFIDNGKILISGVTTEILENHGILKCSAEEVSEISDEDIVSVRIGEFGADVMIRNRINVGGKYSRFIINNTTLDEILLFYVRKGKGREWSV